ncbi:MAG: hypothetical protein RMI93_02105 [Caldimicrobium sp.]|nr:hypothetical protein [Caldimicrobium sp.]MDW8182384.1 hypothetical protein [Caldimicrobium sp.]
MRNILQTYKIQRGIPFEERFLPFEIPVFSLALLHILDYSVFNRVRENLCYKLPNLCEIPNLHQFYLLVDMLRDNFAIWFIDLVERRDFSAEEYKLLAIEFLLLDEQVRKRIQISLLKGLKEVILGLKESKESENSARMEVRFFRVVNFFKSVESLEPSKSREIIEEAEELLAYHDMNQQLTQGEYPFSQVDRDLVREKFIEKVEMLFRHIAI